MHPFAAMAAAAAAAANGTRPPQLPPGALFPQMFLTSSHLPFINSNIPINFQSPMFPPGFFSPNCFGQFASGSQVPQQQQQHPHPPSTSLSMPASNNLTSFKPPKSPTPPPTLFTEAEKSSPPRSSRSASRSPPSS